MSRFRSIAIGVMVLAMISTVGITAAFNTPVGAATQSQSDEVSRTPSGENYFAKYDGIDGESQDANHDKWIDVLAIDWGSNKPGGGATGATRRRGAVVVEDMVLTMEYEKSTVKLLESLNMGEVIPKLEIEQTATYGGSRATYLKYELKNVQITSVNINGIAAEGPPTVTIANNFEEYKVTYTEYDSEGNKAGNTETTWKVEKGEK